MKAKGLFKNAPVYMLALGLTAGAAAYANQPDGNGAKEPYRQEQVQSIDKVVRAFEGIGDERYDLVVDEYLKRAEAISGDSEQVQTDYYKAIPAVRGDNEAANVTMAASIRRLKNNGGIDEAIQDYYTILNKVRDGIAASRLAIAAAIYSGNVSVTMNDYYAVGSTVKGFQEESNVTIASAIRNVTNTGDATTAAQDYNTMLHKYRDGIIASRQTISLAAKAALGK